MAEVHITFFEGSRCSAIIVVTVSVTLVGDWNWYLPPILRWLPGIRTEKAAERRPTKTSLIGQLDAAGTG